MPYIKEGRYLFLQIYQKRDSQYVWVVFWLNTVTPFITEISNNDQWKKHNLIYQRSRLLDPHLFIGLLKLKSLFYVQIWCYFSTKQQSYSQNLSIIFLVCYTLHKKKINQHKTGKLKVNVKLFKIRNTKLESH